MKRTLTLALFLVAAAALPLPAATVALSFSSNLVVPGQTFTMDVTVIDLAGDAITGFGMDPFISDPSTATFLGATVGPLFNDDSGLFGRHPAIAGDAFPFPDTAPILLATLSFQTLQTGTVRLGVSTDLANVNEGLFLLSGDIQDINISQSIDSVPEPSVAALMGLGLLASGIARRYSRNRRLPS
jgi:hypothetical protein